MERLQIENYYDTHDRTHHRHEEEFDRIMDQRQTGVTRLFKRGLAGLGNAMVIWGSRLQQREEPMITSNTKGNPSPC